MKNYCLLNLKSKQLIVLAISLCSFFTSKVVLAQNGSDCSQVIPLGNNSISLMNYPAFGNEFWFSFSPDSDNVLISVRNNSQSDSAWKKIKLYSGNCSSLTLIDTGNINLILNSSINASNLIVGNTYFIQLTTVSFGGSVDLSINYFDPSQISSSCSCPAPYNNPGNTCDLICNNSFETLHAPIYDFAQLDYACPWFQLDPGGIGSDLFNSNSSNPNLGVPNNYCGNQTAHTGNGYAGFAPYTMPAWNQSWGFTDYKEYVMVPLKVPLQASQCYTLTFYLSSADVNLFLSGNIGAYFSNGIPNQPYGDRIHVIPQILFPQIIGPGWIQLTALYTAIGGEQYLTIGNFDPNAITPNNQIGFVNLDPSQIWQEPACSYYYIDDVTLEPCCPPPTLSSIGPVCTGSTFTLSATSNCPANNFLWSPINQIIGPQGPTVTATATVPGNYFNCTMNLASFGCTVTDSILISLGQVPTVNAGSDISICKGQSVTLHGTGTSNNYGWTILNGAALCTSCTTAVVTPAVTTSYVYWATNSHGGCTGYDTMTVIVNPLPSIQIVVPSGAVICDGSFTFSATGVPPGSTYSWNSDLLNPASTTTFSADWPDNALTDGYVILTITDPNGCTGYDSVVIPHCCCAGYFGTPALMAINDNVDSLIAHYPGTVFVSSNNTTITTQTLCISGIFTVNRNLDLKNVVVSMGTNARINILPGFTLTLRSIGNSTSQQTVVQSCDKMWDGIYVNAGAVLKVKDGTIIEDGKQAIVSINGGDFQIQGGGGAGPVKLNKNLVAIWVKPFAGTHPGFIRNAIISCDGPTQPGGTTFQSITSPGQNLIAPFTNYSGMIGVRIDSVNSITIGDSTQNNYRNVFERMRYGVFATKSNVNVWNNDFRYISSFIQPSSGAPYGVAVYATNKVFGPTHTLTAGRLGSKKSTNRFQWCNYGVMAEQMMDLYCQANKFDSCTSVAIYSLNNASRTILINADTLHDCIGTNIKCFKSNNSFITITNNQLNQGVNPPPSNFGTTGIYVANSVNATTHLLIQNNTIKKMRNGIWVSRVNNAKILDNGPITFIGGPVYTLNFTATGIHVDASVNVTVKNNIVRYANIPTVALYDKMFGIYIENCKNDTVTKNHITRMGSGIFLKGADNPSLLACNRMDTCWYGINFNRINNISTLVSINDQFLYQNTTPAQTGNLWNGTLSSDLAGGIIPINSNGIHWYRSNLIPTMGSLVTGSIFGNASQFSSNNQCNNLLTPLPVSDIVQRDYMLVGICKNARTYDTLSDDFIYTDLEFAYRTLRENPSWLHLGSSDDIFYQTFYNYYTVHNIGKLADAEDAIANGNLSLANSILLLVKPEDKYNAELNRVLVMNVFLHSWSIDSLKLTDGQRDTLLPIANQGSLTGGLSVFDARNMLGIEVHDSTNLRINQNWGQSFPSINKLFPNPTHGRFTLTSDLAEDENGVVSIFDLTGRVIISYQIKGGEINYNFDLSFLKSGSYLFCITSDEKLIMTDRIIILSE